MVWFVGTRVAVLSQAAFKPSIRIKDGVTQSFLGAPRILLVRNVVDSTYMCISPIHLPAVIS